MAGGSDLQPSKSAKNAATCKKRQGADVKKKKQSCDIDETSHNEKKTNDRSGKKKEVDKDSKVAIKKEKEGDNSNTGAVVNKDEEVLKNYHKLSEDSVNKNKEDCKLKGAANINKGEQCNNVNYDKGILNKNDVHKKDALSNETDSFIKGVASVGENKECSNSKDTNKKAEDGFNNGEVLCSRFDSDDVNKEMIKESESGNIDKVNLGNKIKGTTKNEEKDICNSNNNIEFHKKENEVKAVSVNRDKEDAEKAKESAVKEDCIIRGVNDSASSGDKDSPNKSSPKKRQFGYNYRGRGSYGNNRGRNFNWRGRWGYNNYNRYQNRRMMSSGPSSAYRGNDQPRNNSSESCRGNLKTSSPHHPEAPPQAIIGPLQPVYFDSQINYQDCYYFPQVWPPQQTFSDDRATTYHQETLDISGAHANVEETEAAAYNPYAGDVRLATAMEAIEENVKAETNGRKDLYHQPTDNEECGPTHPNNQMTAEANQVQEGHGLTTNIIASVSSNPLFELGKSAEHDKQLVHAFAGIEMRPGPGTQLPPGYGLQWFFIPYGAALPPSVIPVMVVPFLNAADSAGNVYQARQDGVYQARQDGNSGHDRGFPPSQSLLPSYFNNVDLQTPSPVDTLQPAVHTWPNQVMAPMTAGNPAQYVFPQIYSSQTEIHAENKFKAN